MRSSKLPPCFSFSDSVLPPPSPSSSRCPLCEHHLHHHHPLLFFFHLDSLLANLKSGRPTFWLLHLMSVSEQLIASKKHCNCAYRTRFKCVSTDLQTQHTPGGPDMGKFPSYLHTFSSLSQISTLNPPPPDRDLKLHGENGWNHMGNNLSLHTLISSFSLDLFRHLE